jgi:predicted ester cyclase
MDAKAVVARCVAEVLNGGGPGSALDLISEPRFRRQVAGFRDAFPDLAVTARLLISDGDLVAGHFIGGGTHAGLFAGIPATGRRWSAACTGVYRVADGRIADAWVTWDRLSLLEQLGAVERVHTVSA